MYQVGSVKMIRVILEREVVRPEGEAAEDLVGRLERHVQQPIDRQQQEDDVDRRNQVRACASSPRLVPHHQGVEQPAQQQDDQEIDERHRRRRAEIELAERRLDQVDRQEGG